MSRSTINRKMEAAAASAAPVTIYSSSIRRISPLVSIARISIIGPPACPAPSGAGRSGKRRITTSTVNGARTAIAQPNSAISSRNGTAKPRSSRARNASRPSDPTTANHTFAPMIRVR